MSPDQEIPLAAATREKMKALRNAASDAHKEGQYQNAASLLSRCLDLAEALNDTSKSEEYRYRFGYCLAMQGKYRHSLMVLAPILQTQDYAGEAAERYNALVRYIDIALCLPLRLEVITKACQTTEIFLVDIGRLEWQHKILLQKSSLFQHRGLLAEALAIAQEAWANWDDEYPCFAADTHLDKLVEINLQLRDDQQAEKYLQEWESRTEKVVPKEADKLLAMAGSHIARFRVHWPEAVDWARRAVFASQDLDFERRRDAIITLIRAFLCTENLPQAREELGHLLSRRHSEQGHSLFEIRLLCGDHHLAWARKWAGLTPTDDEYYTEFVSPQRAADPDNTRVSLRKARWAFNEALKIGWRIDNLLQCSYRQEMIAARLERVKAIEQCL